MLSNKSKDSCAYAMVGSKCINIKTYIFSHMTYAGVDFGPFYFNSYSFFDV